MASLNTNDPTTVKTIEPKSRATTSRRRRKPISAKKAAWLRYQVSNALGRARMNIERAQERGVDLTTGFSERKLQAIAALSKWSSQLNAI